MRILSYNILNGGEGRADPLAEVIEAQRADIVALVEADNLDVVERIARRLRMDYVRAEGAGHLAALLSRWPIVESINHAALRGRPQALLEAQVAEPGGDSWVIGVVHLHARAFDADETVREEELTEVLGAFARQRDAGRPHLLCGDFNANSPIQRIDPEKCKPRTREAWAANGGGVPRRVIQRLLDAGYVDVLHAVKGDAAATAASFTTQYPGQRIDYVFTWGIDASRLRDAWIETDRLAKYASDHFPVGAEIGGSSD